MNNTKGIIYLVALAPDLESDLVRALSSVCHEIRTVTELPSGAQVVFCPSNLDDVTRLRAMEPSATIIVVSRHPEVTDWLDSIEAGANDYCAAPFEASQLQWILQSSHRASHLAAA
jgi:CheY-like chemotaxis protein